MDKLDFQISAEAVQYLRRYLLRGDGSEPVVLTIAPTTRAQLMEFDPEKIELSQQELEKLAKEHLDSLPSPLELHWSVGASRKSRLPKEDMLMINGIECFLPSDVRSVIKGRVLRVENGELVFDPRLEPPAKLYHRST
jgi:hypothetical protein